MNILTENFCPECDEVVHQVFDREDFYRHEVGALYCPKCGHLILPCNECDDHSNCMDCPWSKCAERSTAMSDEAYMRYLEKGAEVVESSNEMDFSKGMRFDQMDS